jgi:hypothetical protein
MALERGIAANRADAQRETRRGHLAGAGAAPDSWRDPGCAGAMLEAILEGRPDLPKQV